jgi:PTS system nitrogen regulatory IIA component
VRVADLLKPDSVIAELRGADKGQVLRELTRRAAPLIDVSERTVHVALLAREKLGSTGVGAGVAIPHARITGLNRPRGLFARLAKPIAFDAIDSQPVDLIFLLLVPDSGSEHMAALASVSRTLRNPTTAKLLRGSTDPAALYAILTEKRDG